MILDPMMHWINFQTRTDLFQLAANLVLGELLSRSTGRERDYLNHFRRQAIHMDHFLHGVGADDLDPAESHTLGR